MDNTAGTPEQIIKKLRQAEALIGQGMAIDEAARKLGVAEQTCYQLAQRARRHEDV